MSQAHENSNDKKVFIIKKVIKRQKHSSHGGSWKIAYADFVTAMMAFFLLMWLLSLMNKYQLMGISKYFNRPLKQVFTSQSMNEKQLKLGGKDKYLVSKTPSGPSQFSGAEHVARKIEAPEVNIPLKNNTKNSAENKHDRAAMNREYMEKMRENMLKSLDKHKELREFKNMLNFIITANGLKIEIRDLKNKPMFSTGNSAFMHNSTKLLKWLAGELNQYPKRVVIIGHTDSAPYEGENYTNWELSADRANATRRELIKNGMHAGQIVKIIGVGDTVLLDRKNGLNPANRRIDIVVLSREATDQ